MAHGNPVACIVVSAEPRGVFLEGTIGDTSAPGTKMVMQYGTAFVGGRPTWVRYGSGGTVPAAADGDPRMTAILCEDKQDGIGPTTAYAIGQRCFLYVPLPGEEMNILCAPEVGTGSANAFHIGDRFICQHTTGQYVTTSTSSVNADFVCMEHVDLTPDVAGLVWAQRQ